MRQSRFERRSLIDLTRLVTCLAFANQGQRHTQEVTIMTINLKHIALALGLVQATVAFADPPPYNGLNYDGFVRVGSNYMYGTMNVGVDSAAGHNGSYLYGSHSANGIVSFGGRDAVNQLSFFCSVAPGNPLYAHSVDIANNLTDAAYLYVLRNADDNQCSYVYLAKDSYYLH